MDNPTTIPQIIIVFMISALLGLAVEKLSKNAKNSANKDIKKPIVKKNNISFQGLDEDLKYGIAAFILIAIIISALAFLIFIYWSQILHVLKIIGMVLFYIGIVILCLIFFFIVYKACLFLDSISRKNRVPPKTKRPSPRLQNIQNINFKKPPHHKPAWNKSISRSFKEFYHGTDTDSALEIYFTNLWLIDDPITPGIYMTDKFKTAKKYAGEAGLIVVLYVHPKLELKDEGKGYFVCEIPEAKKGSKEYYQIEGIIPVAVLDYYGNRINPNKINPKKRKEA